MKGESKMREVSGQISMLGNSRESRGGSTYSVIKIGSSLIEKLQCVDALENFVHVARDKGDNCTLYIEGRRLVGVKLSNGDFYCYKMNILFPLAFLAILVFLLPFCLMLFWLVVPIPALAVLFWLGIRELKIALAGRKLKAQGAVPLSVTTSR
jgi:hypothetical protein